MLSAFYKPLMLYIPLGEDVGGDPPWQDRTRLGGKSRERSVVDELVPWGIEESKSMLLS